MSKTALSFRALNCGDLPCTAQCNGGNPRGGTHRVSLCVDSECDRRGWDQRQRAGS